MMKKFLTVCIIATSILSATDTFAQSAAELQMAKSMARSYGYSESEINAMLNQKNTSKNNSKQSSVNIDRNIDTRNQQYGGLQYNNIQQPAGQQFNNIQQAQIQQPANGMSDSLFVSMFLPASPIFGHNLFKSPTLDFIPNYNIPTPASYKLAPGDEVIIDIWGATYYNLSTTISPEGSITIEQVGPVYLTGYTIDQAQRILADRLSAIYSGISGENPDTFIRVTLGKIRSLSVNVVGDVEKPGTYTLPSLSTVFTAMYMAGGPSNLGSLRTIQLYRKGKLFKTIDLYEFILNGNNSGNVRLEDDDLIIIPPYVNMVEIYGNIKRPMKYELKEGETVSDLIRYAAGFSESANTDMVHIVRKKGERTTTYDLIPTQYGSFPMEDGDMVRIPSNIRRNRNTVNISGAVWYPGDYAITEDMSSLKDLIEKAGGLRDEAFRERGQIIRLNEVRDTVSLSFNVDRILSGEQDITLFNQDSVSIFSNSDLKKGYTILTQGNFNDPQTLLYREGLTLGDVIILSGGQSIGSSPVIEVARRNFSTDMKKSDTTAIVFNLNLEEAGSLDFKLMPYDIITSRILPNFRRQHSINVRGEVNFPGYYVFEQRNLRVSDVVKKAGGYTIDAYLEGATISRLLTEEEYQRALTATKLALAQPGIDTSMIEIPTREDRYLVGFNLKMALENPKSYNDVILRDGDILNIPELNSTVKISGAVLHPNVVTYNPSITVNQYIKMAGGYVKGAIKKDKYIVFMNGMAATRGSKNFKPMPGCEIIVPKKDLENTRKISAAEIVSIASSTTSVATMVVSMINILKR